MAFTDIFTVQGNAAASTIVDDFMRTSCSSSSISMVSSGQKANREPICSPRRSVEILRSVKTNTCYEPRRAISVDLGNSGFKSLARNEFKENVKQRRWQWQILLLHSNHQAALFVAVFERFWWRWVAQRSGNAIICIHSWFLTFRRQVKHTVDLYRKLSLNAKHFVCMNYSQV